MTIENKNLSGRERFLDGLRKIMSVTKKEILEWEKTTKEARKRARERKRGQ